MDTVKVQASENNIRYLEKILNGIPDIIKVYNADHTIAFYNAAAYKFYGKKPEEVENKKYYEISEASEKAIDCYYEKTLKTKKMLSFEKYIPKYNRYMDVCFNPVLGENGEVIYVIERLRDITDNVILNNMLKDSEKRYGEIINIFPDAIIIVVDNVIVMANKEACELIDKDYERIIGASIYKYFPLSYSKILRKRLMEILKYKKSRIINGYRFEVDKNNNFKDVKIYLNYLLYKMKPAVQIVISDITEMKRDLNKAAAIQKKSLQQCFPVSGKVYMESVYKPAHIVSGDSYRIYRVNDDLVIGIIIDVSGNGIAAALNISAMEISFNEEVSVNHNPLDILNNLNIKINTYFSETYIAACCFSMNFKINEMRVAGAGINKFIVQKFGEAVEEKTIKGPFLGMFKSSEFDEKIIPFRKGDRFFFFTDGLEFIVDKSTIVQRYMRKVSLNEFKKYVNEFLEDTINETGKLEDDCTLLELEIL